MPEGHVLHRAARLQGKRFVGHVVELSSPQGRFGEGAERLSGQRLDRILAKGKHLFYQFDSGDEMHVHLGLFGKFKLQKQPFPDPSPNCRMLMDSDADRLHLAGPTRCEVLEPDEAEKVRDRLGPDPILCPDDGAKQFAELLSRRTIAIGKALMAQDVISGIGNVYRSELLFQIGLHPLVRAKDVCPETVEQLWEHAVRELRAGERIGRIITTHPSEFGVEKRKDLSRGERLYAYKRAGQGCVRCSDTIVTAEIDGRKVWWCPTCQPA